MVLTAFCVALALIMLALAGYVAHWYIHRGQVRADNDRYASLYQPARATPSPTPGPTPALTARPVVTEAPTAEPTQPVTAAPTPTASPAPTLAPTRAMPVVEDAPLPAPSQGAPTAGEMPVVEDVPIPTPNGDTLVIALPTAPPVQESFGPLLAMNPETVGFLDIAGMLSLPVVQRENDNDYYLSHDFEGGEADEGTLFLDGTNRLAPEDDCLIVYGHNMKNGTMFGKLSAYGTLPYLRRHPVIRFDTIYENRSYVVFAAFTASMTPGDRRYFDVRQFIFDEAEFDKFALKLQSRSIYKIPVEVEYGDRLLLLVTCDYTNREGRFILALRQLRQGENEADLWAKVMQSAVK